VNCLGAALLAAAFAPFTAFTAFAATAATASTAACTATDACTAAVLGVGVGVVGDAYASDDAGPSNNPVAAVPAETGTEKQNGGVVAIDI
jgi:hypothetical protein